jgi:hypothetical protein
MIRKDPFPDPPELQLTRDRLAQIIILARAYDAQVAPSDPDSGSNAADDSEIDALEDRRDNTTAHELRASIVSLDEDARTELVALAWIGRGDYEAKEWSDTLITARERKEGKVSRYLMGMPLLGDLLEEGAAAIGINVSAEETAAIHAPGGEPPAEDDRT